MLKNYIYRGKGWQFEEKKAPAGAIEVNTAKAVEPPKEKAVKPANKRKAVKNK